MKIKEMKTGANKITLLLQALVEKETKTKSTYVVATYTDGEESLNAKIWNCTLKSFPGKEGEVHDLSLMKQIYQGADDFTLKEEDIKKSKESPDKYVPCIKEDIEQLYDEIIEVAESLRYDLKELVLSIYKKYESNIKRMPAAKSIHHEVRGGLLLHVHRMLSSAISLSDVYELDWDMVYAGIMLHDIGKIRELETNEMGITRYTNEGTLLGHMPLGLLIVNETARVLGTNSEDLMVISHCLLSHQGSYEMQSSALPCVKEAILIHYLDMIDSRLYQYEKHEKNLEPGTCTEKAIMTINNARVYRRREVGGNSETV